MGEIIIFKNVGLKHCYLVNKKKRTQMFIFKNALSLYLHIPNAHSTQQIFLHMI